MVKHVDLLTPGSFRDLTVQHLPGQRRQTLRTTAMEMIPELMWKENWSFKKEIYNVIP